MIIIVASQQLEQWGRYNLGRWFAAPEGIVLVEVYGGIDSILMTALMLGVPIFLYIYVDIDAHSRGVVRANLPRLRAAFPHLLPASACEHWDSWP